MLEFEVIASSSAGCAYRLSGAGAKSPLLIECGVPFKQLQRALDFKTSELCGCLVSHAHQDHCKAVKELMKAGIECFASVETWDQLGREETEHHLRQVLTTDEVWHIFDWYVKPFEAIHDCDGTLGFVIESPDGSRLLYLTDSCYSKFKFPGLTHIAIECNHSMAIMRQNVESGAIDRARFERVAHTHLSLERLIDLLNANDLSQVQEIILLHLSDQNSDEMAFKNAVEKATGIPCRIASK